MLALALLLASSVSAAIAPAPCVPRPGSDATEPSSLEDLAGCQRKALDDAAVEYAKANAGKLPPEGLLGFWRKGQKAETRAYRVRHPEAIAAAAHAAKVASAAKRAAAANAKRLNVYVAPWCPHCREATGTILELKSLLAEQGIATRIVVGGDSRANCEEYARSFGEDAVIDAAGKEMPNGVPHFSVTRGDGSELSQLAGFPPGATAQEMEAQLGLP